MIASTSIRIVTTHQGLDEIKYDISHQLEELELADDFNLLNSYKSKFKTKCAICIGWDDISFSYNSIEFVLLKRALYSLKQKDISYSLIIAIEPYQKIEEYIYKSKQGMFVPFASYDTYLGFDDEETRKQVEKLERKERDKYGMWD